jgi:hypothetical protein
VLEIAIFGAAYGEATVLSFDTEEGRKHGVVDCYFFGGRSEPNPVVRYLKEELDAEGLAFVIATHPHDDHIRGLAEVVEAFPAGVEFFAWWGGLDPQFQIAYFKRLECLRKAVGNGLRVRSRSVKGLLDAFVDKQPHLSKWHQSTDGEPSPLFQMEGLHGQFTIKPLSPWVTEQAKFIRTVMDGVHKDGSIDDLDNFPNKTSLGLFIAYKDAKIILGGDVEKENWTWAFDEGVIDFAGRVHFVKIPHHGSPTGTHKDMWEGLGKFVGSEPKPTVAVTTRFYRGKVDLPDDDTLRSIAQVGCDVWVVAGDDSTDPVTERVRSIGRTEYQSLFCVEISPSGDVEITPGRNDKRFEC